MNEDGQCPTLLRRWPKKKRGPCPLFSQRPTLLFHQALFAEVFDLFEQLVHRRWVESRDCEIEPALVLVELDGALGAANRDLSNLIANAHGRTLQTRFHKLFTPIAR